MTLPVPEFLRPILTKVQAGHPERLTNIRFVPSAAGVNFDHYFGTVCPINFWYEIHDLTAATQSTVNASDVLLQFYSTTLYTIAAQAYVSANYLGVQVTRVANNHQETYENILSQHYLSWQSTFNPIWSGGAESART